MNLKELESKITSAALKYYAGLPEMSDAEFDELTSRLPKGHELLTTPGWGASELVTAPEGKMEVDHKTFIGGLPKSKYAGEEADVYEITHKLDGITGVAYYNANGFLEAVVTRGDGNKGIRVDAALNVPETFEPNAIIRGEIVIDLQDWEQLQELEDTRTYKHPRNAASGIVMSKSRDLDDYLTFIAYDWMNSPFPTQSESIEAMDKDFFCLHPVYEHEKEEYDNKTDTEDGLPWKEVRPDTFVVVDGSVWRHVKSQKSHAFKYENLEVRTTVMSVEWIPTDRGRLAPTVHIEQIELDGATIRKCSGKSAKFIVDQGIGPGAEVMVRRANNVIPDIVSTPRPVEPQLPVTVGWSWSGANIRLDEGRSLEEALKDVCRQMILAKSKKGIAEKAINQFVILEDDIDDCEMNLDEKVGKTFNAVEQGLAVAKTTNWSEYELLQFCKIDGVGQRATVSYLRGEATNRISKLIAGSVLYSTLLAIYRPSEEFPKGFVHADEDTGMTKVCITGSLDGFTKKTFAEKFNLQLVDVKDADIVIASDPNSAKAKRAAKLEKTIMTQQEFVGNE